MAETFVFGNLTRSKKPVLKADMSDEVATETNVSPVPATSVMLPPVEDALTIAIRTEFPEFGMRVVSVEVAGSVSASDVDDRLTSKVLADKSAWVKVPAVWPAVDEVELTLVLVICPAVTAEPTIDSPEAVQVP